MPLAFPEIRVGDPIRHEGLAVFPLFAEPKHGVDYDLSDEALNKGIVTVEEVSEAGSVPDLAVENSGDLRVLFLEGEELVGAKQNRILNTSVLIAAHTKSKIPVSCVEAGRWGYKSRQFGSGGTHSSSMLRRVLKSSVSRSVREKRGHRSDQGEVWEEVARQQRSLGASSGTSAMSDTFEALLHYHSQFVGNYAPTPASSRSARRARGDTGPGPKASFHPYGVFDGCAINWVISRDYGILI